MRLRSFWSSCAQCFVNASGSRSKRSRRRTTSMRAGMSVGVFTSTARPKRSSNCGLQFAFFRVAAADQHEARGVPHAEALALDHVLARGGDVEQEIDEMVLEQIDLVDIEKAAIGLREQARLEGFFAMRERALEIERADDAILGRAQRQIDDGNGRAARSSSRPSACARGRPRKGPRASPDRNCRRSRRRRASSAAAPPARAPRSICRCRDRRTPARRRRSGRSPRSRRRASCRPGRRSRKTEKAKP